MDETKNLIKYVSTQKLFILMSHHFDCFNKFSIHNTVKKRDLDLWAQTFVCRCKFFVKLPQNQRLGIRGSAKSSMGSMG